MGSRLSRPGKDSRKSGLGFVTHKRNSQGGKSVQLNRANLSPAKVAKEIGTPTLAPTLSSNQKSTLVESVKVKKQLNKDILRFSETSAIEPISYQDQE